MSRTWVGTSPLTNDQLIEAYRTPIGSLFEKDDKPPGFHYLVTNNELRDLVDRLISEREERL